ncbi:MAG: hypothetical protein CVV25_14470 [Ignavibacteriae bacterium HGW-Ignavibacteriae-4]|nr:MAG: hypothetical protein CVV25_14470 [Ignavibacteriae bacterium HGW-Ignavibacteriae-4]
MKILKFMNNLFSSFIKKWRIKMKINNKNDNKDKKEFWTTRNIYLMWGFYLLGLFVIWLVLPSLLENIQSSISALFG